ncbi:MAG TPA: hypothetical protein VEQ65_05195 [Opitutus sp.]|nr:hypothetical protein [Opitutus sp.]
MDLPTARKHIQTSFARMDALYRRPLFDEWAILSSAAPPGVLAYSGPRGANFRLELEKDAEPLRAAASGQPHAAGDFEFAAEAGGTRYDACMMLGDKVYLVCNHTTRSLAEIRADSKWLKAQAAFFDLSERFRADPLEV